MKHSKFRALHPQNHVSLQKEPLFYLKRHCAIALHKLINSAKFKRTRPQRLSPPIREGVAGADSSGLKSIPLRPATGVCMSTFLQYKKPNTKTVFENLPTSRFLWITHHTKAIM
jgi:hypothetical protein